MNNESAILQELKVLNSGLADVSRSLPYNLPEGYFANFQQKITALVTDNGDAGSALTGINKAMPFDVPQNYFGQLPQSIMTQIAGQTKATPLEVPENYFTSFPARALQAAKAVETHENRIIPASWFVFKHIRLAAAAVLLICIGLGAYTTVFNTDYRSSHEILLSSVAKTEIEAYLDASEKGEPEDIGVANLPFDRKDIVVYLNETGWE